MFICINFSDEYDIKKDESKKQIQAIFAEIFESKSFAEIIQNTESIKNRDDLLVTNFSNTLYKKYIKDIKKLKEFKFNFLEKDLDIIIGKLENNYMVIDENEFGKFKLSDKRKGENYKYLVKKLKENFNFSEEEIKNKENKIKKIILLSNYILENPEKTRRFINSNIESLVNCFKSQINNAYKIYEQNLKLIWANTFIDNLSPLMILRNSIKKTNSININTKKDIEKDEKIKKLKELGSKCSKKLKNVLRNLKQKL